MAAGRLSSPGLRPFLAKTTKSPRRHPPRRCGLQEVRRRSPPASRSPSRPRWSRHEAARRSDMANIGSFKKVGNDFQGEIVTLSVQTKNVRIVAEANRANDNAPTHRIYVGRAEIGAAWSKRSN